MPAYLISGAQDLDGLEIGSDVKRVGIISGASTPELLVEQVVDALKPDRVSTLGGTEENITFVLPREFRDGAEKR